MLANDRAMDAAQVAAGVVFVAPDNAVLLLCRSASEPNYGGHWGLPGGKGEDGETPWMTACRECDEEIGTGTKHAWLGEPTVIDEAVTPTGMTFTTFVQPVRYRFTPEIDGEHCGFVWAKADGLPAPMHPQVARVLAKMYPEGQTEMPQAQDERWEESKHPRQNDGKFGTGSGSSASSAKSGKHESLKREDVYSTLNEAEKRGGGKAVKELAAEIASERPDLKDALKKEASFLDVKVDFQDAEKKENPQQEHKAETAKEIDKYSSGLKPGEYAPKRMTDEQAVEAYERYEVPDGWFVHGRSGKFRGRGDPLATGNVIQVTDDLSTADQYAGKTGTVFFLAPGNNTDVIDVSTDEGELRLKKAFEHDFNNGMLPPDLDEAIASAGASDDADEAWEAVKDGFDPPDIVDSAGWYDTDVVNWMGEKLGGAFIKLSNKGGGVALDPSSLQRHELKDGKIVKRPTTANDSIAMDKNTVRRVDADGHMFVETTPISKANVCDYYGKEIPGWDNLGLDPERLYKLYRDPKELDRAAPSFAGKPLLLIHKPINASDHPREIVVGSIGDGVSFEAPYLMAPLNIWDAEAIALVESGEQRELSSAYRYTPDMTPGTVNGEAYDGVMRDISANHLALVRDGRAGSDCLVMDSAIPARNGHVGPNGDNQQETPMKKTVLSRKASVAHGAIIAYLMPKLAQDAKVDLTPALKGVTSANFETKKSFIVDGIKAATAGKLAQDADIDDVVGLIDALKTVEAAEEEEVVERTEVTDTNGGGVHEFLASKLSAEDMKAYDDMMAAGQQEAMDEDEEDNKDMVTKPAMDAAINAAVKRVQENARAVRAAEDDVRPYIGNIAIACDSAEEVYRTALTSLNVDVTGVHPSAFKAILKTMPAPGSQRNATPAVAMDAKSANSFHALFPEAKTHVVKQL